MQKGYLKSRVNNLLGEAIKEEMRHLKTSLEINPVMDVENQCNYIGVLIALKKQAKDLIEKL